MKTIEQVRGEFECPTCKKETDCSFQGENVHCSECGDDFDLGMKKYR